MTPAQQKDYDEMIAKGESHFMAEMLATQTSPGLQTDTRFLTGKYENGFYSRQLQKFVSSRADVKKACAEKNYDCEGSVSHKSTWDKPRPDEERAEAGGYKVSDDIVDDAVFSKLVENPTALKDNPNLINETREKLAGDMDTFD